MLRRCGSIVWKSAAVLLPDIFDGSNFVDVTHKLTLYRLDVSFY